MKTDEFLIGSDGCASRCQPQDAIWLFSDKFFYHLSGKGTHFFVRIFNNDFHVSLLLVINFKSRTVICQDHLIDIDRSLTGSLRETVMFKRDHDGGEFCIV